MSTWNQIAQFVRWRDWGPGKLTILWSLCLYIAVARDVSFSAFALTFVVFMVFAGTQSALGYVLNEWGDRELDRRQFKRNAFTGKSSLESMLALALMVVMAFVTGLPLIVRTGFFLLWLAWMAAAAAYSLEPVRLKTKGIAGLAVSFVAQWFLPVLITFAAFEAAGGLDMWALALALMINGATLELGHQRYDRTRDMLTRAQTFAASVADEKKIDRLYALALLLDKLAIGLIVVVIARALDSLGLWWARALAVTLGVAYLTLFLLVAWRSIQALFTGEVDDPYYGRQHSLSAVLHQTLLNFVIPVFLGLAVSLHSPLYGVVFGLFLIWRVVLGHADWLWPLRAIRIRTK